MSKKFYVIWGINTLLLVVLFGLSYKLRQVNIKKENAQRKAQIEEDFKKCIAKQVESALLFDSERFQYYYMYHAMEQCKKDTGYTGE